MLSIKAGMAPSQKAPLPDCLQVQRAVLFLSDLNFSGVKEVSYGNHHRMVAWMIYPGAPPVITARSVRALLDCHQSLAFRRSFSDFFAVVGVKDRIDINFRCNDSCQQTANITTGTKITGNLFLCPNWGSSINSELIILL